MRTFSKLEQDIINQLYDTSLNNGLFLQNILFERIAALNIEFDWTSSQIKLVFPGIDPNKPADQEIISRIHNTQQLVVQVANLLSYLEKSGLVMIVQTVVPTKSTEAIETTLYIGSKIYYELPDKNVNELFMRYLNKKVYTTLELDDLREHRFVARDARQMNRQMVVAWAGIVLSFLLGVFSVFFSIKTISDQSIVQSIDSLKSVVQDSTVALENAIDLSFKKLSGEISRGNDGHNKSLQLSPKTTLGD